MEHYNGPHAAKIIKDFYNNRSKYLHSGRLLSSRSYLGKVIPQLDSSSDNGVISQLAIVPLHNLREFTSYCIRAVIHEQKGGEVNFAFSDNPF